MNHQEIKVRTISIINPYATMMDHQEVKVRLLTTTLIHPSQPSPPLDSTKITLISLTCLGLVAVQSNGYYYSNRLINAISSLPFSRKLVYEEKSGDVAIDYSPTCAEFCVPFAEAEADSGIIKLIEEKEHDVDVFRQLVPDLDTSKLPAPLLSVQVTKFKTGGMAIGFSIHHAVADGRAVWKFMHAWTAACRGGGKQADASQQPFFDRGVIKGPWSDEVTRGVIRRVAPNLPVAWSVQPGHMDRFALARWTFILDSNHIDSLKKQIVGLSQTQVLSIVPPSTFVAVSAHAWISSVGSQHGIKPEDETYLCILADCRSRLDPPIDDWYFGNCIKGFAAKCTASNLLHIDGLLHATIAIQKAIKDALEQPLKGIEDWLDQLIVLPPERLTNVAASPRFKVYDTDFGWGKPSRVELVSMSRDGAVTIADAKDGDGVQVSVCIDRSRFNAFESRFLNN